MTPTTGLISSTEFSVVILARLQDIAQSVRKRYLDVKNGTSDNGLYATGQALAFAPTTTSNQVVLYPNVYAQVVYVRDASAVIHVYVNGSEVGFGSDRFSLNGVIDGAATLRFFRDQEGDIEQSAGAVARIRVYDGALTPAEVAALDDVPVDDPCAQPGAIVGTDGADTLTGTAGPDVICGKGGNDKLNGGGGDDRLLGGDGNDTLDGGAGADRMQGEGGTDTATYASRSAGVRVVLDEDAAADGEPGEADDVRSDVENVTGGAGLDSLNGSAAAANTLLGGGGDDILTGAGGNDKLDGGAGADQLTGGAGADSLTGGSGDDTLSGDADNDSLDGGSGADIMWGGDGTDGVTYAKRTALQPVTVTIGTDAGADDGQVGEMDDVKADVEKLTGGAGNDTLTGNDPGSGSVTGNNTLTGGAGDDALYGLGGNDTLDGGIGADRLDGGVGSDTATYATRTATEPVLATLDGSATSGDVSPSQLDGPAGARDAIAATVESLTTGGGNDVLTGNALANTLDGKGGADTYSGGGGSDTVTYSSRTSAQPLVAAIDGTPNSGDISALALDGPAGARDTINADVEKIKAGAGNDTLTGSTGANTLYGGAGDDTLDGGTGKDRLDAGSGADTLLALDGFVDTLVCSDAGNSVTADNGPTVFDVNSGC